MAGCDIEGSESPIRRDAVRPESRAFRAKPGVIRAGFPFIHANLYTGGAGFKIIRADPPMIPAGFKVIPADLQVIHAGFRIIGADLQTIRAEIRMVTSQFRDSRSLRQVTSAEVRVTPGRVRASSGKVRVIPGKEPVIRSEVRATWSKVRVPSILPWTIGRSGRLIRASAETFCPRLGRLNGFIETTESTITHKTALTLSVS